MSESEEEGRTQSVLELGAFPAEEVIAKEVIMFTFQYMVADQVYISSLKNDHHCYVGKSKVFVLQSTVRKWTGPVRDVEERTQKCMTQGRCNSQKKYLFNHNSPRQQVKVKIHSRGRQTVRYRYGQNRQAKSKRQKKKKKVSQRNQAEVIRRMLQTQNLNTQNN